METRQVDVAIIGAGTAGLNARKEAERANKDWVLIEAGPYGTTCARVGCMPSKLLIAAADLAHDVSRSGEFGIRVGDQWRVDGAAVLERVRRERDRFVGFVVEATEAIDDEHRIRGHARFVGTTTLQVDDHTRVEANTVVIATGTSPWIPPQLEPIAAEVAVNDDVFEWQDLPESLAIFGTGVVGLELGQALARLGVEVEFFNPFNEIARFSDPVVFEKARDVFSERLALNLEVNVTSVESVSGGVRIVWTDRQGEDHERVYDRVLAAAGRRANVAGLDLDKADLPLDERGLPVSNARTLQVGDTPVFVAGDVSGHRPILHEASDEGRMAGANAAAFPAVDASIRKTPLEIAFTSPQMAIVGKRYEEFDPCDLEIGQASYDNQGRARVMGVNCGVVRVYAEPDRCRLVGAEMFGPRVEHTAHLLAWAIHEGATVHQLLDRPFYHPVFEEGIRSALRDLAKSLKIIGQCPPQDRADAPGA